MAAGFSFKVPEPRPLTDHVLNTGRLQWLMLYVSCMQAIFEGPKQRKSSTESVKLLAVPTGTVEH